MSALQSFIAVCEDKHDDVESVYAFKGTVYDADDDEVVSVYAFDYEKAETEDAYSVYAFDCMNRDSFDNPASSETDNDVPYRFERDVPASINAYTWDETSELYLLVCLAVVSCLLVHICRFYEYVEASYCFVGPTLLFACCYVYNRVDIRRMQAYKQQYGRQHDEFVHWAKLNRLTIGKE